MIKAYRPDGQTEVGGKLIDELLEIVGNFCLEHKGQGQDFVSEAVLNAISIVFRSSLVGACVVDGYSREEIKKELDEWSQYIKESCLRHYETFCKTMGGLNERTI